MHVMTWNINSVRLRLESALRVFQETRPDVVCLQETKTTDDKFPYDAMRQAGFSHIVHIGEKSYNGVAILSKIPFKDTFVLPIAGEDCARHIAAKLASNITIHNLYVPAGGDIPDISVNPKYAHKLQTIENMEVFFNQKDVSFPSERERIILVGDLNIAPLEHDVWSHKQLLNVISHTPAETTRMERALEAGRWIDLRRMFVPKAEKHYTWWSYRNKNWRKSNRGRRLDHIWCSQTQAKKARGYLTHAWTRDLAKPSDHIPVSAIFEDAP